MGLLEELLRLFVPVVGVGILMTLIVGVFIHWLPIIAAIVVVAMLLKIIGG